MLDFAPPENRISPPEGILIEDADARARERRRVVTQPILALQSAVRRLREFRSRNPLRRLRRHRGPDCFTAIEGCSIGCGFGVGF